MSEIGITAFGAYVPRLRIERSLIAAAHAWMAPSLKGQAKGRKAFPSWDEDAVTMAVEAARDALGSGIGKTSLDGLCLASTTLPYADLQNAAIVAGAIDAPIEATTWDVTGSQRAGVSALLQALKGTETTLVVGSEAPVGKPASTQEIAYGAGAAAFLIGTGPSAARLRGAASVNAVFVDHFRPTGAVHDYVWEERWVRDEGYGKLVPTTVKAALKNASLTLGNIRHFVMPSMLKGAADAVAKKLGFEGQVAPGLEDGVGYSGSAHALLMLAATLETAKPGELILLIGFGQGVDALILEVGEGVTAARRGRSVSGAVADGLNTDSYLRMLSFAGGIEPEWGMRSEKNVKTALTEQYRSAFQLEHFNAGKCGSCGTIQFPQLQACVNCAAPRSGFTSQSLIDEPAKVLTSTSDWLSYYPAPPLYVGFVQFDNGARVLMETVDVPLEGLEPGAPLRMVFRIKERDRTRGYNRYFWKSAPAAAV
jgi:3-hydroxy-3-methylglutaryl CoA synthase